MTEPTHKTVRQQIRQEIRDLYDFPPEIWEAIDALGRAEQRIRRADRAQMEARIEHVRATLPDRMREQGYDIPEGLNFEWRT